MAVSMCLTRFLHQNKIVKPFVVYTRSAFFSRKKKSPEVEAVIEQSEDVSVRRKYNNQRDGPSPHNSLQAIRDRGGARLTRGYKPPENVVDELERIVTTVCGRHGDWRDASLDDPLIKFKVLNQSILAFNHNIPNNILSDMKTMDDVLAFFQTEVKETSALEDLSKLDLPKNLHIEMNYNRFDPETDTFFGGVTAFPGNDTKVTSLKYRKMYASVSNTTPKPGFR